MSGRASEAPSPQLRAESGNAIDGVGGPSAQPRGRHLAGPVPGWQGARSARSSCRERPSVSKRAGLVFIWRCTLRPLPAQGCPCIQDRGARDKRRSGEKLWGETGGEGQWGGRKGKWESEREEQG